MIESIYIENIKGCGNPGRTFALGLRPDKYNICFAPNGFGKSSLAAAVNLLVESARRIQSNKTIAHRNDETLPITITIRIDGTDYTADMERNQISRQIMCHVISSRVDVTTTQQNRGKYTHVEGLLDINDVIVYRGVPQNVYAFYSVTKNRVDFGENGKILSNFQFFLDAEFLRTLIDPEVKNALDHIRRTITIVRKINLIRTTVNGLPGTTASIRASMATIYGLFEEFNSLPDIQLLKSKLLDFCPQHDSDVSWFDFLWQLFSFWEDNRRSINAIVRRLNYLEYKQRFTEEINQLNNTWRSVSVVEKNGNLVVEFPKATQISNGQRDFLTFVSDFTRIRNEIELNPGKKHLVVVDEVLDYLDDANMLALQHYFSNGLLERDGNVYTCMLTHLSPQSFRSYIFSDKKVNRIFLDTSTPRASESFLAFIAFRSGLDRNRETDNDLYNKLSAFFFHYNTNTRVNVVADLTDRRTNNLKTTWGEVKVLKQAVIDEVNSYLQGQPQYDPYAVCMGIRHKVEKEIWSLLPDEALKVRFIEEHKTIDKIKLAEDNGINVPAHFNLVTALHNDADHVSWNQETLRYREKPIVYSLRHPVIRNMVAKMFGYEEGNIIPVSSIL